MPSSSESVLSLTVSSIKKGRIPGNPQVFAVKFIHKEFALKHGNVTKKQLDMEITLHKYLGAHANLVQFFQSGENVDWKWIAMELAEGGDLFDKIESDVGVGEDIAHVYFTQLISAVCFMHSKGVGHRDIKPENILLSSEGNLKIADFGLATLFDYQGQRKTCKSSCGSPPYTAPEVLLCTPLTAKQGMGYFADYVDIWSCGVVLFVLLVGNTPWDEPKPGSYEFDDYVSTSGHPEDELWHKLPANVLSLLRGMMKVDAMSRFSLTDVRRHPWFTRSNPHLTPDGKLVDPVNLATQMFEKIHIDFSQPQTSTNTPRPSQHAPAASPDAMDVDIPGSRLPLTQPETPTAELTFDWETNPSIAATLASASQPAANGRTLTIIPSSLDDRLAEDPALSQFAPSSIVPLSLTQAARRFGDILPAHSLTRFVSLWTIPTIIPVLKDALQRLGVPVAEPRSNLGNSSGGEEAAWIKVRFVDERKCLLKGDVVVETVTGGAEGGGCVQVCFVKSKGDPVQWRRFFKKVVVLCGEVVWRPE